MAYFLILVLGGTLLWLMRSYLAEEDNDYYRRSHCRPRLVLT